MTGLTLWNVWILRKDSQQSDFRLRFIEVKAFSFCLSFQRFQYISNMCEIFSLSAVCRPAPLIIERNYLPVPYFSRTEDAVMAVKLIFHFNASVYADSGAAADLIETGCKTWFGFFNFPFWVRCLKAVHTTQPPVNARLLLRAMRDLELCWKRQYLTLVWRARSTKRRCLLTQKMG